MKRAYLVEKIYTGETYIPEGRKHPKKVVKEERTLVEILEEFNNTCQIKYLEGSKREQVTRKRKYKLEFIK